MYNKAFKLNQSGNSLIEILVTLFILAAGLFGLASLQIFSLKSVNNAQFHSLATVYAYDMAERIRSNRNGIAGYDLIKHDVTDPNCATNCSSIQMAQQDGFLWNEKIKSAVNLGGLPEGEGSVTRNGNLYRIIISWREQQRGDAGSNVGQVGDAQFVLNIQI